MGKRVGRGVESSRLTSKLPSPPAPITTGLRLRVPCVGGAPGADRGQNLRLHWRGQFPRGAAALASRGWHGARQ